MQELQGFLQSFTRFSTELYKVFYRGIHKVFYEG